MTELDATSLATHATMKLDAAASDSDELSLDDAELVAAYRAGNLAAYGELARRHQIPLFRLLLGLLANEDLAELACEQVFVVANRRLEELDQPERFYHWLLPIAREVSTEFLAREEAPGGTQSIHTAAPREQLKREVHAVLQALAPDHRLALVLVEFRNAEHDEVAAALGCELDEVPEIVEAARKAFVAALGARESGTLVDGSIAFDGSDEIQRLDAGTVVAGRYRIEALLGAGGMGAVYRAQTLDEGVEVALKTMLPGRSASEEARRRFEREAEAIGRLDHANFVKILDHGQTPEALRYLVMEYLRGRSLADLIYAERLVDPARALGLVRELLEGLEHAHGEGVVHRDLKPDNVMLVPKEEAQDPSGESSGEQPKILDLGLAKLLQEDDEAGFAEEQTRLTRQGMVFGTPAYMAPEQALGQDIDARVDLYAVTVLLYELLTGQLPFSASNPSALLVKHVSQPPPRLATVAVHLAGHEGLQHLIDGGLAKQPEARIPSARAYLEQIDALLRRPLPKLDLSDSPQTLPLPAAEPAPWSGLSIEELEPSPSVPEASRSRVWVWALLALAVIASVGLALALR